MIKQVIYRGFFLILFITSCQKKYLAKDDTIYLGNIHMNDKFDVEGKFLADVSKKDNKSIFTLINDSITFTISLCQDKKTKKYAGTVSIHYPGYEGWNYQRSFPFEGRKIDEEYMIRIYTNGISSPPNWEVGSIYLTPKKD